MYREPCLSEECPMLSDEFRKKYNFKKPNKDTPLVTHCWAGMRAYKAQEAFMNAGYTHVKSYPGSYKEWYEHEVVPMTTDEA